MKTNILKPIVMASLTAFLAAACQVDVRPPVAQATVTVPGEVVVSSDPPAPLVEVEGVSPGPDFIWIGGAWAWGGDRWVWDRGHWDRPPRAGAVWVPHRYAYRGGQRVFVRGGWR